MAGLGENIIASYMGGQQALTFSNKFRGKKSETWEGKPYRGVVKVIRGFGFCTRDIFTSFVLPM